MKYSFLPRRGKVVGRKSDLCKELSSITGIEEAVLRNPEKVQSCSVAKRMSWASLRDAKEVGKEDLAYCLIGIFLVPDLSVRFNGLTNAMLSLQLEIMEEYQMTFQYSNGNTRILMTHVRMDC